MRNYIEARDGYVLTDGNIFGKQIYLADGISETAFKEITEAECEAEMQNEQ